MPKKGDRHRSPRQDTMKCVRAKGYPHIERVPNDEAHQLVVTGQAVYVPKKDWKAQQRQEKKAA